MSLRLDFCSPEAADFAVRAFHYSHGLPAGRLVCVGAWEAGAFVGAVIFGRGASSEIGSPFGLNQSRCASWFASGSARIKPPRRASSALPFDCCVGSAPACG